MRYEIERNGYTFWFFEDEEADEFENYRISFDALHGNPADPQFIEALQWVYHAAIYYSLLDSIVSFRDEVLKDGFPPPIEEIKSGIENIFVALSAMGRGYLPKDRKFFLMESYFKLLKLLPLSESKSYGFVYIIRSSEGVYKIGRAKNPEDRISTFSVKLPFPVKYEFVIGSSDYIGLESFLHLHYAHRRLDGEWFQLKESDLIEMIDRFETISL